MAECKIKGCEDEATATVGIRLPEWLGPDTMVAEEARDHTIGVCDRHAAILTPPGIDEVSIGPSG